MRVRECVREKGASERELLDRGAIYIRAEMIAVEAHKFYTLVKQLENLQLCHRYLARQSRREL